MDFLDILAVLYYTSCWDFVGIKIEIVGMDPNCCHPKPRPTTLVILLTQPYFCTKRKLNKHVIATSSQQNPTNFFHSVFHFICCSWDFGGMNDWLQEWKSESWLKQWMGELFIWHREGSMHCHNSDCSHVPILIHLIISTL